MDTTGTLQPQWTSRLTISQSSLKPRPMISYKLTKSRCLIAQAAIKPAFPTMPMLV